MKIHIANKKSFFSVISLVLIVFIATITGLNFFYGIQNLVVNMDLLQ